MDNFEETIRFGDMISSRYRAAFEELFNGLHFHGWGQTGPSFQGYLHTENRFFSDSEYYYRGPLEFFHLTTIERLFSILNARAFRLYSLHNSEDEDEYGYAAKFLGIAPERVDNAKRYFFTFSFCPIADLENAHVWKVYGHDYSSAALVFTVENDPANWDNFHMAQVKYEAADAFKSYGDRIGEIEKAYGVRVDCDLSQLIGFHKSKKWADEKEVRIATYFPYKDLEEYWTYAGVDYRQVLGRNRMTRFIELPIWVDNDSYLVKGWGDSKTDRTRSLPSGYFDTRPKIKLKQIIVGARSGLTLEEYDRLRNDLIEITRYKLGYDVEVELNMFGP